MITTIGGSTPQEIANSANMVFRELERDLRPHIVTTLPPSAEGAGDVGQIGEQRVLLETVGSEKRVRYFERLKGPSGDAQWREFPHREIGGPLVIHNQLVVEQDANTTSDGILFRTSTNYDNQAQYAALWARNYDKDAPHVGMISAANDGVRNYLYIGSQDTSGRAPTRIDLCVAPTMASYGGVLMRLDASGIHFATTLNEIYDLGGAFDFTVKDDDGLGLRLGNNDTVSSDQNIRVQCRHYDNILTPVTAFYMYSGAAASALNIGGGAGQYGAVAQTEYAVTQIQLFTGATSTTATGAVRLTIDSTGNTTLSGDLRLDGGDFGLTADTDLIQIAANTVTVNGTFSATTITGMAPSDATYIVQTANATLTNEQALGALTTGLVKNTTTTGVLSIGVADTDYQQPVTWGDGLGYTAPTASVDYNTTNLKITAAQLDTIQSIATAAIPQFAGLGVGAALTDRTLHVQAGSAGVVAATGTFGGAVIESGGHTGLAILSAAGYVGAIEFGDSADNDSGIIRFEHDVDAMDFWTAGAERVRITSAGRLGVNTEAPVSALHVAGTTAIQDSGGGDAYGLVTIGTGGATGGSLWVNTPGRDASWQAGFAVDGLYTDFGGGSGESLIRLTAYGGHHAVFSSEMSLSVTNGGVLAEVMRLDNTGKVGINITAPLAKFHVDQSSTTGAIPVLTVDQADVSEEFIRFIGTSANGVLTQSIVEAADVAAATIAGYLKVYVQDDGNQLADQSYFVPLYTLA